MLRPHQIPALPFIFDPETNKNVLFVFRDKSSTEEFQRALSVSLRFRSTRGIKTDGKKHVLKFIISGKKGVITSADYKTCFDEFEVPINVFSIAEEKDINPSELLRFLLDNGYTRVPSDPSLPGDFSFIGDVFEIKQNTKEKLRVEFLFDTVEKIYRISENGKVERPREEVIISRTKVKKEKFVNLFDEVICLACEETSESICSAHSKGELWENLVEKLKKMRIISASEFLKGKDDIKKLADSYALIFAVKDGDEEMYFREIISDSREPKVFFVYVDEYPHSFIIPEISLSLISFPALRREGKYKKARAKKLKIGEIGLPEISYEELEEGMYVVHKIHGIGIFRGTMVEYGREFLKIEYRDSAMLYIPAEDISLLHKYIGVENPPLDELGGKTFALRKKRVKEYIEKQIPEFLRAIALRKSIKRPPYEGADEILPVLSQTFLFEETEDQKRVIEDIRRDLCERDYPADRLIVGDSGVGKTEVALRAVGIVAYAGGQVAFVCPTTPLAFQHFMRAKERFSELPFKVEMLSRLTPPHKQKEMIEGIRKGEIDIVIGTHKVLNHLHEFRKLGLLIIDEEHRFGVAHKEKISRIRASVDVISISATPIPRTLKMSLSGLKDISIIKEKPWGRGKIITSLLQKEKIKEVIDYELRRGGQVFYIYPFIEGLDEILIRLSNMFSHTSITVVHGKMKPSEIENIILGFMMGKIKILVATKIVALGLDIPNVNTMIVERADLFGLSELYQLRGRVGRGDKTAYCYLLVPQRISENAKKRLDVFLDAVNLDPENAGFHISLKDLEMRGAGNLLGKEQVGHIYSVGFDTYIEILQDIIEEMKEKLEFHERHQIPRRYDFEPHVEISIPAFIPSELVKDPMLRISFYRAFALAETKEELRKILFMILERFAGVEPKWRGNDGDWQYIKELEEDYPELINFFKISVLKLFMRQRGIFSAVFSQDMASVEIESHEGKMVIPVSGIDELIHILERSTSSTANHLADKASHA